MSKGLVKKSPGSRRRAGVRTNTAGIVGFLIQGKHARTAPAFTPSQIVASLRDGLSVDELTKLREHLDLPMEKLAPMLGISKATLHRRKATKRLDQTESDRVVRYARLLGKAVDVFEGETEARQWLASPQVGLGGAVPLQYAETEVGAREVEDLLGRIEYGVYS